MRVREGARQSLVHRLWFRNGHIRIEGGNLLLCRRGRRQTATGRMQQDGNARGRILLDWPVDRRRLLPVHRTEEILVFFVAHYSNNRYPGTLDTRRRYEPYLLADGVIAGKIFTRERLVYNCDRRAGRAVRRLENPAEFERHIHDAEVIGGDEGLADVAGGCGGSGLGTASDCERVCPKTRIRRHRTGERCAEHAGNLRSAVESRTIEADSCRAAGIGPGWQRKGHGGYPMG